MRCSFKKETRSQELDRRIAKIAQIRQSLIMEQRLNNNGEGCSRLEIKLTEKLYRNENKLQLAQSDLSSQQNIKNGQ